MKHLHALGHLVVFIAVPVFADTITISSAVPENGLNQTIGNGITFTPSGGFDFSNQPYSSLADISSLSLALTINDGDSAKGNQDYNKLTLTLGGVNTGLILNGFRDGYTDTLNFTDVPRAPSGSPSTSVGNAILSAMNANGGHLAGGIVSTDKPSNNQVGATATFTTTLSITGDVKSATPPPVEGAWGLTLSNASQSSPAGGTLVYSGTIENNTGANIFIDSAQVPFSTGGDSSLYAADYADAFLATLGIIPTSGYSGPLFTLTWSSGAPVGLSGMGSFELASSTLDPSSISADFTGTVAATPEPSSVGLALAGLTAVGSIIVRSSRRSVPTENHK